jgi:hypothetical protein
VHTGAKMKNESRQIAKLVTIHLRFIFAIDGMCFSGCSPRSGSVSIRLRSCWNGLTVFLFSSDVVLAGMAPSALSASSTRVANTGRVINRGSATATKVGEVSSATKVSGKIDLRSRLRCSIG